MGALWRRGVASARDIHEDLYPSTGWAYTTVKTFCDRLVTKNALEPRRRANQILYEAKITLSETRKGALRAFLEKAFDGAISPLLQHLVDEEPLSAGERKQLLDILQKNDATKGAKKKS